jgi:large subunit ribosomal protein L5
LQYTDPANVHQIPSLEKIVINVGVGEASREPKLFDSVVEAITAISGQKPIVNRARKAISNFGLREGMPVGVSVTLRGAHMFEFLDRFINIATPSASRSR